jgi:hypothetical protein
MPVRFNAVYFNHSPLTIDEDLFPHVDFLSVHMSLTRDNQSFINRRRLMMCKRGVYIVNVSRGALVDQRAMAECVKTGHVAGYGADVALPAGFSGQAQALLTDPQTSGGLLVSCAPAALGQVMAVFARHGFGDAAAVGSMQARAPGAALLKVR